MLCPNIYSHSEEQLDRPNNNKIFGSLVSIGFNVNLSSARSHPMQRPSSSKQQIAAEIFFPQIRASYRSFSILKLLQIKFYFNKSLYFLFIHVNFFFPVFQ